MWVVSPWSRGGWVNSQVFDHTSTLLFLEKRFGVVEPQISAYRRAVCGDLTSAFNFRAPNNEPLPTLAGRTTKNQVDALSAAQQERTVTLELPPGTNGIPFIVSATDANGYSSEPSEAWDVIFEDDFD